MIPYRPVSAIAKSRNVDENEKEKWMLSADAVAEANECFEKLLDTTSDAELQVGLSTPSPPEVCAARIEPKAGSQER